MPSSLICGALAVVEGRLDAVREFDSVALAVRARASGGFRIRDERPLTASWLRDQVEGYRGVLSMRIRVKDAHRHVSLLPILVGILIIAELGWRLILRLPLGPTAFRGATSPLVVLASVVLLIVIPARCQHMGWCAVYGAILGAGMLAAPVLGDVLLERSYLMLLQPRTLLSFATLSLLGAPWGAAMLVAWAFVFKYLVWAIRIQDGTLCPTCAYCIIGLPRNICPECGKEFKISKPPPARSRRPNQVLRRRATLLAILVAVVATVVVARLAQFTPPVYAVLDGRYWKHALAGSERERKAARWALASIVEGKQRTKAVSDDEVRAVMGRPDLVWKKGNLISYLYFDLHPISKQKGEIYLDFTDGILQAVGYNVSGVNDLSAWAPYRED